MLHKTSLDLPLELIRLEEGRIQLLIKLSLMHVKY